MTDKTRIETQHRIQALIQSYKDKLVTKDKLLEQRNKFDIITF